MCFLHYLEVESFDEEFFRYRRQHIRCEKSQYRCLAFGHDGGGTWNGGGYDDYAAQKDLPIKELYHASSRAIHTAKAQNNTGLVRPN